MLSYTYQKPILSVRKSAKRAQSLLRLQRRGNTWHRTQDSWSLVPGPVTLSTHWPSSILGFRKQISFYNHPSFLEPLIFKRSSQKNISRNPCILEVSDPFPLFFVLRGEEDTVVSKGRIWLCLWHGSFKCWKWDRFQKQRLVKRIRLTIPSEGRWADSLSSV